jgi:hypothetical protein
VTLRTGAARSLLEIVNAGEETAASHRLVGMESLAYDALSRSLDLDLELRIAIAAVAFVAAGPSPRGA